MTRNTHKTKNVYIPLALTGLAIVLMLVEVLLISKNTSIGALKGMATIAAEIILYVLILLLGIGLCSWFGYPFDPIPWSLLQLLAVILFVEAVRGPLGVLTGDSIAMLISVVLFLGLVGYFFSDEPMNALIAIFLIFAAHSVVEFFLTPLLKVFLS